MIVGIVIGCMIFSFFFSGMETGVLLLNRARVRYLKEQGSIGARILFEFLHRPSQLSATVLVGNTLMNGVATVLVAQWFLQWGILPACAAVILFAISLWYFCDLVPKDLFRRFPNRLTTRLAPFLLLSYGCLWPLAQLFDLLSRLFIKAIVGKISSRQIFVTRDELKLMAREVRQEEALTGEQRNLVASILDSHQATVRDVMRPRSEVVVVAQDSSGTECRALAVSKGYSRFPIELQKTSSPNVWTGLRVVYDSIFGVQAGPRTLLRIPASASLNEALSELRKAKTTFAAVKSQDNRDIGIVTVEDILRRYLGKIEL